MSDSEFYLQKLFIINIEDQSWEAENTQFKVKNIIECVPTLRHLK